MLSILGRLKFSEDDLKKTETGRRISGLCQKVYVLMLVHLLVLSIKESNSNIFA